MFGVGFSSPELFKGKYENSPKGRMLAKLEANRNQFQVGIDNRYLPGVSRHAKTHAVCSYVLRHRYFQSVGFLESLIPFQKMMTGAGLTSSESWKKILVYFKTIFNCIHDVIILSSD